MNEALLAIALGWRPIMLLLSACATVAHAGEELYGDGAPLWDYLSRRSGASVGSIAGAILVGVVTPAAGLSAAWLAYPTLDAFWLGVVVGLRSADAACTHFVPALIGMNPNPGVRSALLYAAEAAAVLSLWPVAWAGVLAGAVPFLLLWPSLWLLRSTQGEGK